MTFERPQPQEQQRLARNLPSGFELGASIGLTPDAVREVNPDFYAGPPPPEAPGIKYLDSVRSTTYYTPVFHGRVDQATLMLEGAGLRIDADGNAQILSASGKSHEITERNMRGYGAAKIPETLTTYRTIAVDPSVIPLGTWVYVDFGHEHTYTGWYRAEDTGGSIKGNHIDIFAGVGRDNYRRGQKEIPDTAQRIVWFEDGQIHSESSARREKVVDASQKKRGELAADTVSDLGIKPQESGKLHTHYMELTDKQKTHLEQDRKKLGKASVVDIRFDHRFLNPDGGDETDKQKITNLKTETARRIAAYTRAKDGDWYTLDYSKIGGEEHLYGIGLGDILLDPDIDKILVDRGGELIHAKRGVPESGSHKGRQSFVDQFGNYVATYDGDRFKILTNEKMPAQNYITTLEKENRVRAADRPAFERVYHARKAAEKEAERYLEGEKNPLFEIQISGEGSVVDQMTTPLSPQQKANAQIIEREFKKYDLPNNLIAAAIINAISESGLNSGAVGDGGNSIGLFQLHIRGAGHDMTVEERMDPVINTGTILEREVLTRRGAKLRSEAKNGASVARLAAIFARDIERPRNIPLAMRRRANKAVEYFGQGVTDEAVAKGPTTKEKATVAFDFKTPEGLKGKVNLESGQDNWILGSSSAYGMDKYKAGNTGICGIIGANPKTFFDDFKKSVWPKIENLKMPRQVVLMGMAINGLPQNGSRSDVKREIDDYLAIARFFEARGITVKIATVQPYGKKLGSVQKFNETLRDDYPQYCLDISSIFSSPDGQHWKSGMAAKDNLHLSPEARRQVGRLIAANAPGETRAS